MCLPFNSLSQGKSVGRGSCISFPEDNRDHYMIFSYRSEFLYNYSIFLILKVAEMIKFNQNIKLRIISMAFSPNIDEELTREIFENIDLDKVKIRDPIVKNKQNINYRNISLKKIIIGKNGNKIFIYF